MEVVNLDVQSAQELLAALGQLQAGRRLHAHAQTRLRLRVESVRIGARRNDWTWLEEVAQGLQAGGGEERRTGGEVLCVEAVQCGFVGGHEGAAGPSTSLSSSIV